MYRFKAVCVNPVFEVILPCVVDMSVWQHRNCVFWIEMKR